MDTLEKYKQEASLIGYKVIELEEIYKSFGIEIIEIGKSAVLIDGAIIDTRNNSNNIVLSFVKIACGLGYCNNKANFASRKLKLRKVKRNVTDLEVFLDISAIIKVNDSISNVKNKKTKLGRILEEKNNDEIELKITIKEERNEKAKNISLDVNAELGEKATLLKNNKKYIGEIEAVKDGKKEVRRVELKSIDGKLFPHSKISKVEYRKIIGYQRNLFGLTGYIEPSENDGELRLTIEQTEDLDLKNMFNN